MATAKKYIFQNPDGSEQGAFTEDELLAKVNAGLIRPDTLVRSALLRQWKKAAEYEFLAGTLLSVVPPPPEPEKTAAAKLGFYLSGAAQAPVAASHYGEKTTFVFSSASVTLRFLAGLTDGLIVGVGGVFLDGIALGVAHAGVSPLLVAGLLAAGLYAGALLYVTIGVGFYAQTIGQWFWGTMVTGVAGEPVLVGRAFLYALGAVWAGILTPFLVFLLPSRRGVSDLVAGSRTIRTRIVNRG